MVKCVSCGFENSKVDCCVKCGRHIQRYVKAYPLTGLEDISPIKAELDSGNVLIVNLLPFLRRHGVEYINVEVNAVFDLQRYAESIGGGLARLGNERIILAPAPFKIWSSKLQIHETSRQDSLFTKCAYCGESVKNSNLKRHLAKAHSVPSWLGVRYASWGTFALFLARNGDKVIQWLSEPSKNKSINASFYEMASTYMELDEFAERAAETGRFKETILAVEKLKDQIGGVDIELWANDVQLDILRAWKPGFVEAIAESFFTQARCGSCIRKHKDEILCNEGMAECEFDMEFEQFVENAHREIVEDLKKGIPNEPDVSKHIQDLSVRIRDLVEAMSDRAENSCDREA